MLFDAAFLTVMLNWFKSKRIPAPPLLAELLLFRLGEPARFGASILLIPSEQVELSITMLPAATLARPTPRHHLNRPRLSGDPGAVQS